MKKITLLIFIVLVGNSAPQIVLEQSEHFPRWMKNGDTRTDQTSAITFIGKTKKNDLSFLIADDIGDIYRFNIKDETHFAFEKIEFSQSVKSFFNQLSKKDFEEIFYDKHTGKVYLSIEGNSYYSNLPGKKEDYLSMLDAVGIYELSFEKNLFSSNKVYKIKKLKIKPEEEFYKYIGNNFGFEGAAVDEYYFYFGFEGFAQGKESFDSALIYIVDKKNLTIKQKIFTSSLQIQSICGLYSDENFSLWGIDRNKREVFVLKFDKKLNVIETNKFQLRSPIPGYNDLEYVMALESITMDDDKNIYMIDDPWKKFFIPFSVVMDKLDDKTKNNFEEFIPVIHKYKIANVSRGTK